MHGPSSTASTPQRKQRYEAIEIIVCDNASTDDTEAVVTRALGGDPRVRYVRHATNLGAVANFRAGLDLATGEYFMWLADDDWLDPDYVDCCMHTLRHDPTAVLANGDAFYTENGRLLLNEPGINLTHTSTMRRVLGYYTLVNFNGAFHGISTTETRRSVPFDDGLAGDWIHLAAIAALGSFRRVPTAIHRSITGESAALDKSLSRFAYPIASRVLADVRSGSAFATRNAMQRCALGIACAVVVSWRMGVLPGRDRVLAHLVGQLKSRLRDDQYQQLRRPRWAWRTGADRPPVPARIA